MNYGEYMAQVAFQQCFMMIVSCIPAILRIRPKNIKRRIISFTETTDYELSNWNGFMWPDIQANFHEGQYKTFSNTKGKIQNLGRAALLLMRLHLAFTSVKSHVEKQTPCPLVRKRIIPTERPPLVRRNLLPTFADRGVSHGQCGGSLTVVNLSFIGHSS
jgi:hypothetical protein